MLCSSETTLNLFLHNFWLATCSACKDRAEKKKILSYDQNFTGGLTSVMDVVVGKLINMHISFKL